MPTHYLDFQDNRTRAALVSAKREKPVPVLVRQEENRSAPGIRATGYLSTDGKLLHVFVGGAHSHDWSWHWLQERLALYR